MRVISFDCGIRALACVILETTNYDVKILSQKNADIKRNSYTKQYEALVKFVQE